MTKVRTRSNEASASVPVSKQVKIQFQDEGVNIGVKGLVDLINLVGSGVTATISGNTLTITIPGGGSGSPTFIGLTDVPATYAGQALKFTRVNAGENALEFVAGSFSLTNGKGTTANGSAVDLGGSITELDAIINLLSSTNGADANFKVTTQNGSNFYVKEFKDPAGHISAIVLQAFHSDLAQNVSLYFDLQGIDGPGSGVIFEDNRTVKKGIEYAADYSAGFTARSLVDKAYVDANAGGGWTQIVTTATDVNNNGTGNTLENLTPASGPNAAFPVLANKLFAFRITIPYTSADVTNGSRWALNGTNLTRLNLMLLATLTANTITTGTQSGFDGGTIGAASTTAGDVAYMFGTIECSSSQDIQVRFSSETAGVAITALAGVVIEYLQLN